MPEKEMAPEIQQKALAQKIDQLSNETESQIPDDRQGILKALKNNRATIGGIIIAAGLTVSFGMPRETRAETPQNQQKIETQYLPQDLPRNLKLNEIELRQSFQDPFGDTSYADIFISDLNGLNELLKQRQEQDPQTTKYNQTGLNIINQLRTMIRICNRYEKTLEEIIDTSSIEPKLLAEAQAKAQEIERLSKRQEPPKPVAQKFEKFRPADETLKRKSR